ncbi:TorF family putative porin [Acinetobacter baumannii]|uniref:TorF family putative porin n=1 Tax=Acinetobacter baumannii TaxID=470 RepID=UPI00234D9F64|nr:TorF family putative porin [Acinetobacter baumannii]MDC7429293.1 TorF family putative porin [Acinetobacter baumannii]MDC7466698.1 TorF family putative porin [Acinetobacter baumannii]
MLKYYNIVVISLITMGFCSLASSKTVTSPFGNLDLSIAITMASDYIWRGQSQSNGPALQGSLFVVHESGLYTSIWTSNIDDDVYLGASTEVDYYLGYNYKITDDISTNLSLSKFSWLQASELNVYNAVSSISGYGFTLGYKYDFNRKNGAHPSYSWVSYNYELPYHIMLSTNYGHTDNKNNGKDYNDWSIGLEKRLFGLDLNLTYSDTNISSLTCKTIYTRGKACDSNLMFAITKVFK